MPRITIKSLQAEIDLLRAERVINAQYISEIQADKRRTEMLAETEERINRAQHQAMSFAEKLIRLQEQALHDRRQLEKKGRHTETVLTVKNGGESFGYKSGSSVTGRWISNDSRELK